MVVSVLETLSLLDSLTNTAVMGNTVTETVTLQDIQDAPGSIYFVQINETVVATDSVFGKLLWILIDDSETANWQEINDPQTPGWAEIADAQTPGWTEISTV